MAGNIMRIQQDNKNSRSPCSFLREMMLNTPTFAKMYDLIWIFL